MKAILSCSMALCTISIFSSSHAAPMLISQQEDCHTLGAIIKADDLTNLHISMNDLAKRYEFVKKFSTGKGGAFVAIVRDKALQENKVLKIFPSIKKEVNKYNYREPYYTCLNGFITYSDVGIAIDPPPPSSSAFPKVFEIGVTNGFEFGATTNDYVYPYMIFEFIKGMPLTAHAQEALRPKSLTGGYRLHKKSERGDALLTKQQSEAVLYQIAHLLYSLKRLKIEGEKYRFYHADLNSGNIMVRGVAQQATLNAGFGDIHFTDMPLITFIDFGHSTSALDSNLGAKVTSIKTIYHQSFHIFSASTNEFYKNLNGARLSTTAELIMGLNGTNSDFRLYRVMARALYDSGNFTNKNLTGFLKTCRSTSACVSMAPSFFEP